MYRVLSFPPILLLLFCLLLPLPALALDVLALPTVMESGMDAWHYVPASSEPALYPTRRIYRGQPFRLLVLAKDYTRDTLQNVSITYNVEVFDPSGTPLLTTGAEMNLFKGSVSSDTFLLLSRQHLNLSFSDSDPFGLYRFKITARDLLSSTQETSTAEVTLAPISERLPFGSYDEFSFWLFNYYRDPDPARAITALFQYVDPDLLAGEKQAPLLSFLSCVFADNPFLWPHLKSLYSASDTAIQKKILLISALTNQPDDSFFSSLDPDLLNFYRDSQKISLPEPTDRPVTEIEIEILWAEFMATGRYEPIRKLAGALYLASTKGTQEQLASGSIKITPDIKAAASLESVYQTALGSLLLNGEKHTLVKQYLGYLFDSENPDPILKEQIENILAILKKRSNEEEARKHLEKQSQSEE